MSGDSGILKAQAAAQSKVCLLGLGWVCLWLQRSLGSPTGPPCTHQAPDVHPLQRQTVRRQRDEEQGRGMGEMQTGLGRGREGDKQGDSQRVLEGKVEKTREGRKKRDEGRRRVSKKEG